MQTLRYMQDTKRRLTTAATPIASNLKLGSQIVGFPSGINKFFESWILSVKVAIYFIFAPLYSFPPCFYGFLLTYCYFLYKLSSIFRLISLVLWCHLSLGWHCSHLDIYSMLKQQILLNSKEWLQTCLMWMLFYAEHRKNDNEPFFAAQTGQVQEALSFHLPHHQSESPPYKTPTCLSITPLGR